MQHDQFWICRRRKEKKKAQQSDKVAIILQYLKNPLAIHGEIFQIDELTQKLLEDPQELHNVI